MALFSSQGLTRIQEPSFNPQPRVISSPLISCPEGVGVAMQRILTELFFFFLIILSAKTAYALKKDKRKPPQSPLTGGNKMRRLT